MKSELEQRIFDRWPHWFNRTNVRQSLMCFGFECGDGWFDLIYKLCEDIEKALGPELAKTFQVVQVKEKFGSLRFYVDAAPAEVWDLIDEAEQRSSEICETCGNKGEACSTNGTSSGWLATFCDVCAKANDYEKIEIIDDHEAAE